VTGRHQAPKQKLLAGYRAPSLKQTFCLASASVTEFLVFIVECGIVRFLCTMCVFDIRTSSSPLGYLCAKFRFCRGPIADLARGENRVLSPLYHLVTHSPSLFEALGTEAFASE